MNEHTKKLFDQALDKAVPETWTTLSHEQMTKLSQVFAELIVRECVQVLDTCHVDIAEDADLEDNNTWVNATMNTTVNFCMGRVKQHFGVKE